QSGDLPAAPGLVRRSERWRTRILQFQTIAARPQEIPVATAWRCAATPECAKPATSHSYVCDRNTRQHLPAPGPYTRVICRLTIRCPGHRTVASQDAHRQISNCPAD